jgi:hypothetical protein
MKSAILLTLLGAFVLFTSACRPAVDPNAAVRNGVIKHIAAMKGLNVNNMVITVTKTSFNGDKAQADVDIRAKNGDPNAPPMQLTYELQKQGDEWVVLKSQATGGMQHPTAGKMPPSVALPPGHPATNGQMPANHPDFNAILNSTQPQLPASDQQPAQQPPNTAKP